MHTDQCVSQLRLKQKGAAACVIELFTLLAGEEEAVAYCTSGCHRAVATADVAGDWSMRLLGPTAVIHASAYPLSEKMCDELVVAAAEKNPPWWTHLQPKPSGSPPLGFELELPEEAQEALSQAWESCREIADQTKRWDSALDSTLDSALQDRTWRRVLSCWRRLRWRRRWWAEWRQKWWRWRRR